MPVPFVLPRCIFHRFWTCLQVEAAQASQQRHGIVGPRGWREASASQAWSNNQCQAVRSKCGQCISSGFHMVKMAKQCPSYNMVGLFAYPCRLCTNLEVEHGAETTGGREQRFTRTLPAAFVTQWFLPTCPDSNNYDNNLIQFETLQDMVLQSPNTCNPDVHRCSASK